MSSAFKNKILKEVLGQDEKFESSDSFPLLTLANEKHVIKTPIKSFSNRQYLYELADNQGYADQRIRNWVKEGKIV